MLATLWKNEAEDLRAAIDEHAVAAITDPVGRIIYVNDKFCSLSRYSRDELLGNDHRILNANHHPKEYFVELWRTILDGKVWHGEIKNRAKDGTFYWVAATIVPSIDAEGRPWQFVAIYADSLSKSASRRNWPRSSAFNKFWPRFRAPS